MTNKTKIYAFKWGDEIRSIHLSKHDAHSASNSYCLNDKMKEMNGGYHVEAYYLEPVNA